MLNFAKLKSGESRERTGKPQMKTNTTKLSASQEDYLETIVRLIRDKGAARVRDIAAHLSVAKPSVTVALRMLRKHKLVNYAPYELVTLTKRGEQAAERISRRHDALSAFFIEILDLDRAAAEANACRIEHAIGDLAMRKLSAFIDFMKTSEVPARNLAQAFREYYREQEEEPMSDPYASLPRAQKQQKNLQLEDKSCELS